MSKLCISCGAMNRDDAVVCMRCGKVLEQSFNGGGYHGEKNNFVQSFRSTHLSNHNNKIIILGIVGAIVIAAVILIIMFIKPASIVGTWKTEMVDGGYRHTETVTFNENHTGVVTYVYESTDDTQDTGSSSESLEWTRSEGNKYLISIQNENFLIEIKRRKFSLRRNNVDLVYVKQ